MPPTPAISVLNSLYDAHKWTFNDKERKNWVTLGTKINSDYDRLRSGNVFKIYSQNYLHDSLKTLKFVCLDKNYDENKAIINHKKFIEFIEEFHTNFHPDFISMNKNVKIVNTNSGVELNPLFKAEVGKVAKPMERKPSIKMEEKKLIAAEEEVKEKVELKEEEKKTELLISNEQSNFDPLFDSFDLGSPHDPYKLTKEDYKFLEKFYFLLGIEQNEFQNLEPSSQIKLIKKRYDEHMKNFHQKYQKSSESGLKHERESLGFLMCEQYLTSEEDQYMYNELQELKFFLNTLKNHNVTEELINDEMYEKAQDLLKTDFSLSKDIPLCQFINFDINQTKEKERYLIFDKDFLEKKEGPSEIKLKKNSDFYNFDEDKHLTKIYTKDFFAETLEIDEEFFIKIFQMLSYSIPNYDNLIAMISSSPPVRTNVRPTYILLKILSYNYQNFLKIVRFMDISLEETNFLNNEKKIFPVESPKYMSGVKVEDTESYFSFFHALIMTLVTLFIKNNYGAIYFFFIDTDLAKKENMKKILDIANPIVLSSDISKSSIIKKMFSFYEENEKNPSRKPNFEIFKNVLNQIDKKNITKEMIPLEILKQKTGENKLDFYPFFQFTNIQDWPNNKTLNNFVVANWTVLCDSKIKAADGFFKILVNDSVINLISILIPKILPRFLKGFNKDFDEILALLIKGKENLIEISKKNKNVIENSALSSITSNISNNSATIHPFINAEIGKFCKFIQNIIKICKKSLENVGNNLKLAYIQNPEDFKVFERRFDEYEKDLKEGLRFFFLKNKEMNFLFLKITKMFFYLEEMIKMIPKITNSQKYSSYDFTAKFYPIFKAYFRIISFIELKDLDQKSNHDIDFLMNDVCLPAMKRIFTREPSSHEPDPLIIEKTISTVSKAEDLNFDEIFNLIYKIQESIHVILSKIPHKRSPSIYRVFFKKGDLNKINIFCKMEYLKLLLS